MAVMFIHSLKQIWRSLWRYKSFTIINFLGLSIGIAAIAVLYLVAGYEKKFDRLHSDADRIFRVVSERDVNGKKEYSANVPYPTARFFRNEFNGALATEINFDRERSVKIGDRPPFTEKNILFADSLFFQVMDFSMIKNFRISGTLQKALDAPNKVILTESTARRYFGKEDPMGKLIRLDNKADLEVTGIVKDIPATTHLPVNLIISYATLNKDLIGGLDPDYWGFRANGYCYIRLPITGTKPQALQALNAVVQKNAKNEQDKREKFLLQDIASIHFDATYENSNPGYTVSPAYLRMLLVLGAFIMLIACINYINLSTSLAFTKLKEVGIRKTIGASKAQLFFHYLSETVLVTSLATIIGLVIAYIIIPYINQLLNKSVDPRDMTDPAFALKAIGFIFVVSFISGAYPAVILSGFNPIASLKNQTVLPGRSSTILRKGLVVFQFTTSITLIVCTIIIAKQVKYFSNKSLGFNKNAVVEVDLPVNDSSKIESFRAGLQNQTGILNFSFCLGAPISDNGFNTSMKAPELSADLEYSISVIPCDVNYMETYGIKLLAGRWFHPGEEKAKGASMVVNAATVKTLGYKNPSDVLGKKITIGINRYSPTIIGVTENFHTNSLHAAITPVTLLPFEPFYYAAGIRIDPNNMRGALAAIERAWKKVYPDNVYSYEFIDQTLARRYEQETKDYNLFKAFSAISIFICCIGLWGLIAFVVVRKTKEIGIRKVLGATVTSIVALLSKDFLKLVVLALLVASPIAWYFMNKWLDNFAYRIDISWWIFLLAGAFAVVIALLTISFQAISAATANPVKNLRTE
jgi:putative ABC transport system permease protein